MTTNTALKKPFIQTAINGILTLGMIVVGIITVTFGLYVLKTSPGTSLMEQARALLSLDSTQTWWYITRASGLMGYLLIWLSMIWGFAVGSKVFDPMLERMFSYDFHEHLSWLGLAFVGLHVVVLLFDKFQPFTIWQVLFPFVAPYRPFWTGVGIMSFYMFLLVTATFYLRAKLSKQTFRKVHYLSIPAYLGATLHGLFTGTDSPLFAVGMVYLITFLVTVFLFGYWAVTLYQRKVEEREKALAAAVKRHKERYRGSHQRSITRAR